MCLQHLLCHPISSSNNNSWLLLNSSSSSLSNSSSFNSGRLGKCSKHFNSKHYNNNNIISEMVADLYQTCLLVLQVTEVAVVEECLAPTRDLRHLVQQRLAHRQLLVHRQEEEGEMAAGVVEEVGEMIFFKLLNF